MYDGHDGMWGMHVGWWIFWIAFVLIGLLLFWRGSQAQNKRVSEETPLDILKRRYASGEITTEEYEERKTRLERS